MDDTRRHARLEQQLRDERRLRDAAERKAADQAAKARTWRDRAEDRAARIDRLVEERDRHGPLVAGVRRVARTVRGAMRPDPTATVDEPATADQPGSAEPPPSPASVRPVLPHVQLAACVADPALRRIAAQTTVHDLTTDDAGLFEADVVLVEAAALGNAPAAVRDRLDEWVVLDGRQPLVWVGPDPPTTGRVVCPTPDVLRPVFDPAVHRPVGRSGRPARPDRREAEVEVEVDWSGFDPGDPTQLAAAARAEPVVGAPDPVREGDARRRLVWARHTPAAVATDLVAASGWSFEDPTPEVAAILVSNRPDDLRRQLVAMLEQDHPRLQVRVGCHGFSSDLVRDQLDRVAQHLPVDVLDLDGHRELGWCLNRVVEGAGSAVLAKIDDDDHYGPGYLVDALQAMQYAGAAVVGRVCSYTYLEDRGETVLRRVGDEEMFYDGTLVGATMVFTRSMWERGPFPHKTLAEDVGLQRSARTQGQRVYVASRWDFVYRRRGGTNTWRVPEEHFLSNATHAWDGWRPHRADLVAP